MSPLQFTLFFVALLLGYVLVHVRMARFEEHLQKLAGIQTLDERLQAIEQRIQALTESADRDGIARVTRQLDQLHEDLEDLRETTERAGEAQVTMPAAPSARGMVDVPGDYMGANHPAATRIVAVIETRLLQLGYRDLRLLGDLSGVEFTDEVEVQVEAKRNGMPCKGRVVMRNGSVSDVALQTVAQAFP